MNLFALLSIDSLPGSTNWAEKKRIPGYKRANERFRELSNVDVKLYQHELNFTLINDDDKLLSKLKINDDESERSVLQKSACLD